VNGPKMNLILATARINSDQDHASAELVSWRAANPYDILDI
jgi:hypothetical protein